MSLMQHSVRPTSPSHLRIMHRPVQHSSISGSLPLNKANVKVGPLSSLIIKMCRVNVPYFVVCRRVGSHLQATVRAAQRAVRCCPVVKLARFEIQLSHQMLQLKSVFMMSVSCCARGHDKMDTLLRSPHQHSTQFAVHNKRATCFGHAGPSSVRTCTVQSAL